MTNTNIVNLDLSFNVIRADGAEFIAEVTLLTCNITNVGILQVMCTHSYLRYLHNNFCRQ